MKKKQEFDLSTKLYRYRISMNNGFYKEYNKIENEIIQEFNRLKAIEKSLNLKGFMKKQEDDLTIKIRKHNNSLKF